MFRPRRPSPTLVVSIIALLVAMGGTGYAAFSLPKNSVGTKQLKSHAVTGSKIKAHSLLATDFKSGQLPAGPKGDTGAKGDTGPAGDPAASINTGVVKSSSFGDYFGAPSGASGSATESDVQGLSPAGASITARDLSVSIPFQLGNSSFSLSVSIRVNGADTALSCSIPFGSSGCQDSSHAVTIPPNSRISVHTSATASGGTFQGTLWAFGWRAVP